MLRSRRPMRTASATEVTPHSLVPVRWYGPSPIDRSTLGPTLLWLQGGGFFRGGLDQPEAHAVAQSLAHQRLSVATVDYRLAPAPGMSWMKTRAALPRGRFPLPLNDVLAAYRNVRAQSPRGVILGGASAGACLAAAATLGATDEGLPPVGAVLTYGFFHAAHRRTENVQQRAHGHRRVTHSVWALNAMNRNYAGSQAELANRLAFLVATTSKSFREPSQSTRRGTTCERPVTHSHQNSPATAWTSSATSFRALDTHF